MICITKIRKRNHKREIARLARGDKNQMDQWLQMLNDEEDYGTEFDNNVKKIVIGLKRLGLWIGQVAATKRIDDAEDPS